ncbi:hypothetical protein, partial [Pseudomonas savastanoi]|uniref:hypothetical protein n=1 Tax=Pseudomonas savastanoi TaxID=29438 RepID=UPI001F3EC702
RGASPTAFPRWSVRNDERRGWKVRNAKRPQEHYRAHTPRGHAVLDAPRPIFDGRRGADL